MYPKLLKYTGSTSAHWLISVAIDKVSTLMRGPKCLKYWKSPQSDNRVWAFKGNLASQTDCKRASSVQASTWGFSRILPSQPRTRSVCASRNRRESSRSRRKITEGSATLDIATAAGWASPQQDGSSLQDCKIARDCDVTRLRDLQASSQGKTRI